MLLITGTRETEVATDDEERRITSVYSAYQIRSVVQSAYAKASTDVGRVFRVGSSVSPYNGGKGQVPPPPLRDW